MLDSNFNNKRGERERERERRKSLRVIKPQIKILNFINDSEKKRLGLFKDQSCRLEREREPVRKFSGPIKNDDGIINY